MTSERTDQLIKLYLDIALQMSELNEKVVRLEGEVIELKKAALSEEETENGCDHGHWRFIWGDPRGSSRCDTCGKYDVH